MKERFATMGAILAGCLSAAFVGCSESSSVAGNSAETGSPELAGVLYLDDGAPARNARVRIVGSSFDYFHGSVLDDVVEVNADSNGAFAVDSLPKGLSSYSLEAFHEESGKRLLIKNLSKSDSLVDDTLQNPGSAILDMEQKSGLDIEGLTGRATIVGTTFAQDVIVKDDHVYVDSLPEGSMDVEVRLFAKDTILASFDRLNVVADSTVRVEIDYFVEKEPLVPDTVVLDYAASLKLQNVSFDSAGPVLTDIPLAFRMNSSVLSFDSVTVADSLGRFEAYRINAAGKLSNSLPISIARLDSAAGEAVFWVRLDSLNLEDSVKIVYNSQKESRYATDVFPSNAGYRLVWHFDEGADVVSDVAENKSVSNGIPGGVKVIDGVVGNAYEFDGSASVTVKSSDDSELNLSADTLSFALWVRLDDKENSSTIFAKDGMYSLSYVPKDGFVVQALEDADTALYVNTYHGGDSLITAGEWNFVYFQNRNGIYGLYVNGVKIPQGEIKAATTTKRDTSADFVLGKGFKGAIDELFLGTEMRYEEWIRVMYANQDPKGHWPEFTAVKK